MLSMRTVDNFRTFETDKDGNELHMTPLVCDVCDQPSEVYVEIRATFVCKRCLSIAEDMWNKAFIKHAKRDRKEQERFLRGE